MDVFDDILNGSLRLPAVGLLNSRRIGQVDPKIQVAGFRDGSDVDLRAGDISADVGEFSQGSRDVDAAADVKDAAVPTGVTA